MNKYFLMLAAAGLIAAAPAYYAFQAQAEEAAPAAAGEQAAPTAADEASADAEAEATAAEGQEPASGEQPAQEGEAE